MPAIAPMRLLLIVSLQRQARQLGGNNESPSPHTSWERGGCKGGVEPAFDINSFCFCVAPVYLGNRRFREEGLCFGALSPGGRTRALAFVLLSRSGFLICQDTKSPDKIKHRIQSCEVGTLVVLHVLNAAAPARPGRRPFLPKADDKSADGGSWVSFRIAADAGRFSYHSSPRTGSMW
jgi:hypothetical protein